MFGKNLRERRVAQGWTLEEAAGRLEMDPAQFRRIEAGQVSITLATLVRLSRAFALVPSQFVSPLDVLVARDSGAKPPERSEVVDGKTVALRLSRNMARLRARHGLTQRELAARAGVGVTVVAAAEARRTSPTLRSVVLIAQALGVSADVLIGEAEWPGG